MQETKEKEEEQRSSKRTLDKLSTRPDITLTAASSATLTPSTATMKEMSGTSLEPSQITVVRVPSTPSKKSSRITVKSSKSATSRQSSRTTVKSTPSATLKKTSKVSIKSAQSATSRQASRTTLKSGKINPK